MTKPSKGPELWRKAKTLIPGGSQLLSKRSEIFLPEQWPSYYTKAKGCQVWDLDGNTFYDFSQMGVGSCVLGYADKDVNQAVKKCIDLGSMCTFNCWEEVELAKKLISLHPWAQMARFAKTGGEACMIAVRIARAAKGKDKVAICGYHGWHDWYLSANLADNENLTAQLLPGLNPLGVPKGLKGSIFPFHYSRADQLEKILSENADIAAVIMEPARNTLDVNFLKAVRKLTEKYGVILIFDEITSGFRICNGGLHLTTEVEPDMTVLGKAMGNGFPISAVIGKKEFMQAAQETFISSTFWTERIGFVASLTTIEKFVRLKVSKTLVQRGKKIKQGLQKSANKHGLPIEVTGLDPLIHLKFTTYDKLLLETIFTQEMLKQKFLSGSSVYLSYAHTPDLIEKFLATADKVFAKMHSWIDDGTIKQKLEGPIKHSKFERLN